MPDEISLSLHQARLAWSDRQSLTTSARAKPLSLVARIASTGWIPFTSPASAYLSLLARGAIARRSELDEALFTRGDLAVVPGPRGLSWIVPTADAPLARAFAMADHTSRESRVASTCGLTSRDLLSARDALRKALAQPRTPAALQAALPAEVLRPLGPTAKRSGVATLAGLALRALWVQGEVTRDLLDGRLDRSRIQYALTPLPKVVPSGADAAETVAARWIAAHAPTSAKAFAEAFSLAGGRAVAALKPLRTVRVTVEGLDESLLAPADFERPPEVSQAPCAALLPAGDPYADARPALAGLFASDTAPDVDAKKLAAGAVALLDGEVVGSWSGERAPLSPDLFATLTPERRAALEAERARASAFLLDELALATERKKSRDAPMIAGEFSVEL